MNGHPVSPFDHIGDTNFDALIQLLTHPQTNYAFFAVSRIKIISQIIGAARTRTELIPKIKKLIAQKDLLDYEIKQLLSQVVAGLQQKE